MDNTYIFENYQGQWFVDLPDWEGDKDELEMVMGADALLDIISEGYYKVKIKITTEPFDNYQYHLELKNKEFEGAWYTIKSKFGVSFECWLCSVTKFVFDDFPKDLYFRRVGIEY